MKIDSKPSYDFHSGHFLVTKVRKNRPSDDCRGSRWKLTRVSRLLSGRNFSPFGALLLRHMPLQRRQAFPRLLLIDHRRHPPQSAERESQNLETGYRVSHEPNVSAREARGFTWQSSDSRAILPRFTSFREDLLSKPLSRAHAHLENGQLRRAGPDWTALRTVNRCRVHAITPSGAPVTFQPPMWATTASNATTKSVAAGRI